MNNHPNRGWRSRWHVDLDRKEACHADGWAFCFYEVADLRVWDWTCVRFPASFTARQIARIGHEAVKIYAEALKENGGRE